MRVSEGCVLRIARSTSFGAGNLAGKPRAPKHWCHCQNSALLNLPLLKGRIVLRLRRWSSSVRQASRSAMILRIATAHLPNARSVVAVPCLCGSNVPLQAAHHAAAAGRLPAGLAVRHHDASFASTHRHCRFSACKGRRSHINDDVVCLVCLALATRSRHWSSGSRTSDMRPSRWLFP